MDYNHQEVEKKWKQKWADTQLYKTPEIGPEDDKYYVLDMYPYPSGAGLHVGHVEGYAATDIVARYMRMKGKKVLHPMGWDSFGLPAENYAIKTGVHPTKTTNEAIKTFKSQIDNLGLSYDWDRELASHTPEYHKWTQWLFLKLYEKGLAYQKEAPVNWCPTDNTVLANEQVVDGKCERCDSEVVQKNMKQWFFKITDYADRLIADLDKLDWPDSTKAGQLNWIGRSQGATISFKLKAISNKQETNKNIEIRLATNEDAEAIAEIQIMGWLDNNTNPDTGVTAEYLAEHKDYKLPVSQEKLESRVKYMTENPDSNIVAVVDGTVVGWLGLTFHDDNSISFGVYTHRDHRGQGIGTKLLKYAFDKYSDRQFKLGVTKHNDKAIKLYERLGFKTTGESEWRANPEHPQHLPLIDMERPAGDSSNIANLEVYTTAHDTIYGATFMVIAPEHAMVETLKPQIENWSEVEKYINDASHKTELERQQNKDKTGVELKGIKAINPVNGAEIPVFIADYVLVTYGTGSIMAVPGHDERDFEFAEKYEIPVIYTVKGGSKDEFISYSQDVKGNLKGHEVINSGEFDGMSYEEARPKILAKLEEMGVGTGKTEYRLRDWLAVRQRYWGAPVPVVYDPDGKPHPADEAELPIELPTDVDFKPTGQSPLVDSETFHQSAADRYGEGWRREVDTLDTFVDSSWYFFRFADNKNEAEFASSEAMNKWLPVDLYVGGAEHTVLHLLYARFFTKFLYDEGYINFDEPFTKLRHPGMILAEDNRKMSKRWGNVINPDDEVDSYGADTVRLYEMFMGPFKDSKPWNTRTEQGVYRFLKRVWNLKDSIGTAAKTLDQQEIEINKLIKFVGNGIEDMGFNTVVSKYMEFVNFANKSVIDSGDQLDPKVWERFILVLAPFAPFMTEELWEMQGHSDSVHLQSWPKFDEALTVDSTVTIGIQINGKLRSEVSIAKDAPEAEVKELVMADENVQKHLEGKELKKFIYVPGRIISIVLGS